MSCFVLVLQAAEQPKQCHDDARALLLLSPAQPQVLTCVFAVVPPHQVTDGRAVLGVHNGVAMLPKITAAGCSVTALIAGFLAVAQPEQTLLATAAALAVFG